MLSIILAETDEPTVVDYTEAMVDFETSNMEVEVIRANNWREGLDESDGDFLCYLEADCLFTENFFLTGLNLLAGNSHFRQLAMVSPILCARYWDNEIHGYSYEMGEVVPRPKPEPTKSYLSSPKETPQQIPIGYFPGSIIRRSAAQRLFFDEENPLKSSAANSLMLWEEGNRILLNPYAKYVAYDKSLIEPEEYGLVSEKVLNIFKRELIA